jgi:hypothetical protein
MISDLGQLGQAGPGGPGGPPMGPPVPARLRPMTATGRGGWLRGSLQLAPGSIVWVPDSGVSADSIELANALAAASQDRGITDLQTPAGGFQLELDPDLFGMSQQMVAEAAGR